MGRFSRWLSSFRQSKSDHDRGGHPDAVQADSDAVRAVIATAGGPVSAEKGPGVAVKAESSLLSTPKVENTPILVETAANEVIQPGSDLRLFALIVTIDSYKNENIPDLSGCVNDGKDFQYFLTDALRVPPSRILSLSNQDATRSAILNAFMDHLIQNDNIRKGDAIVFFYAGHGSRVEAPTNWLADGNMIETIVPHDEGPSDAEGEVIYGIPDRTFDGLMRQLAHEKGDNITAIFDSCHSGGMSRGPLDMIPRAVPPNVSPSPVPPALDENIWRWGLSTRSASTMAPTGFLYKAMQSHVLMAACRPDEQALEASRVPEPHGAFTLNLLKTLCSQNLAELTYARLIELVQLRHQHPQCEGINKDRVLFNATKLVDRSRSFRVTKQKLDGALSVQAGSIHGVVEGTEFVVETSYGTSIDTVQNVVFTTTHVEALQSILVCKPPATLSEALRDFRVVVSKWNSSTMKARFHYPVGSHCSVVGPNDYSDVAVHLGTGIGWQLERCDPLVARHASRVLNIPRGDVSETLDAVARFNFHLYRHHPQAPFKRELAIELRKLEVVPGSGLRPLLQPIGDNYFSSLAEKVVCAQDSSFNVDSVQEAIITDMEPYYGLTLVNDTEHDLFPYVFYFDPNDYSVQSWYLPHSPSMTPPLLQKGRLAIGYGASGTDSLRFSLPSGSKVDTGFLKVFVSTSYADMRSVPQPSVLDRSSRSSQQNRKDPAFTDTWDEFICVLTCKASSP